MPRTIAEIMADMEKLSADSKSLVSRTLAGEVSEAVCNAASESHLERCDALIAELRQAWTAN